MKENQIFRNVNVCYVVCMKKILSWLSNESETLDVSQFSKLNFIHTLIVYNKTNNSSRQRLQMQLHCYITTLKHVILKVFPSCMCTEDRSFSFIYTTCSILINKKKQHSKSILHKHERHIFLTTSLSSLIIPYPPPRV